MREGCRNMEIDCFEKIGKLKKFEIYREKKLKFWEEGILWKEDGINNENEKNRYEGKEGRKESCSWNVGWSRLISCGGDNKKWRLWSSWSEDKDLWKWRRS